MPSGSLLAHLRRELMCSLPFAQMSPGHVEQFISGATQLYFAPGEVVLEPASGPVQALLCIRQGSITGRRIGVEAAEPFEYHSGDLFPVDALLGQRAVMATYTANEDCFCLRLRAERVHRLAELSPAFAEFMQRRAAQLVDHWRRATQAAWALQALAEHSLDARLDSLPRKQLLACGPSTPLAEALTQMRDRHLGSVLVLDEAQMLLGMLTRHDILDRVALAQCPLSAPIASVMSKPVHSLTVEHTLEDAALLMSRQGVRHVPVTELGRVVSIVSERDLFALQRLSITQLSTQIRAARDKADLRHLAQMIRRLAGHLLGQGAQARQLTALISHLNDLLTERLVRQVADHRGMDLGSACWVAFGSEGRGEQTVATDQDNGLVLADADADRPRWLALALEVNEALDACGYPLCKGGVMASNPQCCLTEQEWQSRFAHWMEQGSPEDLLKASTFFDLRALCGNTALAEGPRLMPAREAARKPRFLKQLADNALRNRAPLNWRGALDTQDEDGHCWLDLKLHGTAIFVDAARLFALSHGLPLQGTGSRLHAAAAPMHVPAQESEAWVGAFEFLQMLRLQVQIGHRAASPTHPNRVDVSVLNEIDQRMLKETMRIARRLQQRIELDHPG